MKTLAKWSIQDYHNMIATGIFGDRRLELLGGEIVEMSPESPLHYYQAQSNVDYLQLLLKDKAHVRFNGPITLLDSEPEPDSAEPGQDAAAADYRGYRLRYGHRSAVEIRAGGRRPA